LRRSPHISIVQCSSRRRACCPCPLSPPLPSLVPVVCLRFAALLCRVLCPSVIGPCLCRSQPTTAAPPPHTAPQDSGLHFTFLCTVALTSSLSLRCRNNKKQSEGAVARQQAAFKRLSLRMQRTRGGRDIGTHQGRRSLCLTLSQDLTPVRP
jgi:hypothetical protein